MFLDWFRTYIRRDCVTANFKHELAAAMEQSIDSIDTTKSLEFLVKKNTPNAKIGSRNLTAIHFAVTLGEEHHVTQLIEQGADLNALSVDGAYPLLLAVQMGSYSLMRLLLNRGANCTPKNTSSIPLHWIFMLPCENIPAAAELLVERGGINSCLRVRPQALFAGAVDLWGMPMHCCLITGCEIGLLSLLNAGASINTWASHMTMLDTATALHLFNSVHLLLSRGASPVRGKKQAIISLTNCDASTVYQRFLLHGIELEESAILTAETFNAYDHSLDSPDEHHKSALMISLEGPACLNHVTKALISSGANVEARGMLGYPVLWYAISGLQRNVNSEESGLYKIQLLLDQGINIEACGLDGMTALHICAVYDMPQTARLLIRHGANPNALSADYLRGAAGFDAWEPFLVGGATPLVYAAKCGSLRVIEALLENGADIENIDLEEGIGGGGAAVMALMHGEQRAAEMLINVGTPVPLTTLIVQISKHRKPRFDMKRFFESVREIINFSDLLKHKHEGEGSSFLHHCIKWANDDGVQFLLEHGADAAEPYIFADGEPLIFKFSKSDRDVYSSSDVASAVKQWNNMIGNEAILPKGTYSCIQLARELRDNPQELLRFRLGFLQFKDYQKRIDKIIEMLEHALEVNVPSLSN